MNYGIKTSIEGNDVKDASDVELSMSSKYSLFKGVSVSKGFVTLTDDDSTSVVISHGLTYVPFYRATSTLLFADYTFVPCGDGYLAPAASIYVTAVADSTNITLSFVQSDAFSILGSQSYYYSVIIYKDKMGT